MLPTHLNHAVKDTSGSIELVGVLTDVTAAKCSEEQLSKTQAELAHIMCMTTLGELTASIAYEVNRPLPQSSLPPRPASAGSTAEPSTWTKHAAPWS
jgi:phosphoglycerate-specific signal transduction histidine kinase